MEHFFALFYDDVTFVEVRLLHQMEHIGDLHVVRGDSSLLDVAARVGL